MENYILLSQELLYAARTNKPTDEYTHKLASATETALLSQLPGDDHKKAFWLNLYNAYVQVALKKDASLYTNRSQFYTTKFIQVTGYPLSLDIIEHGFLRRSAIKWGAGFLRNPFPSPLEKKFRLTALDNRIHFALNCGATSCPPIAFYKPEQINPQLELATGAYLAAECKFSPEANRVQVPKILLWFYGDFKGKQGILQLLQKHEVIPSGSKPHIQYKAYNWAMQVDKFF